MKNIADHIFDILENSVAAGATEVEIILDFHNKHFFCKIIDNGKGIKSDKVTDPFVTSRKERKVGLGLPLLKRTVESTGGSLKISNLKRGSCLEFETDLAHIDAKPFGDLPNVFIDALICWPGVDLKVFLNMGDGKKKEIFNSKKIKKIIDYSDLQQKEIRNFIYQSIDKGLQEAGIDAQFGRL